MELKVQSYLWNDLALDDSGRYMLALACFYLGKGVEETRDVLNRDPSDREVAFIVSTAAFCGLNPETDTIEKV